LSRGILTIFNSVAPGREADFDGWFQGEHLTERLSIPGFLYGRRHKAVSGAVGYFNFYVTETPAVLASAAYLARVNDPTPRSRAIMSHVFRDMHRTVCRRDYRAGRIRGGMTVAARFATPQDGAVLQATLDDFARDETVSGEVWSSAETGVAASTEEKLRGGDRKIAHCLLVDTLHRERAEAIGEQIAALFPQAEIGVFRVLAQIGDGDA
jgi:hypothetical protein